MTLQGGSAVIVIPRKAGQGVVIGDEIVLKVVEVRGDMVRLGVEHPGCVTVHGSEVHEATPGRKEVGQGAWQVPAP
jgi:carbon storage regulator CsrA